MLCDIEITMQKIHLYGRANKDTLFKGRLVKAGAIELLHASNSSLKTVIKHFEVGSNTDAENRVVQAVENYGQWRVTKGFWPSKDFLFTLSDWELLRVEVGGYEWSLHAAGSMYCEEQPFKL